MTELRKGEIYGSESGEVARVTNGGLDVNIQDQHTRALDLRFIQATGAVSTVATATAVDDMTVTVADAGGGGTAFEDEDYVGIFNSVTGAFYFGMMIAAPSGNVLSLDSPIDSVFPIGSTVLASSFAMNVDGSSTREIFQIGPTGAPVDIDITRFLGVITDGSAMDDGKFGALDALEKGCVLRVVNGEYQNLWNVKTNGDFKLLGFDFPYTPASPAGVFGGHFRITYAGPEKHGVVLRLDAGDTLEFIIQDDLSDLTSFEIMAQGHIVE